jgi:hypothetical protein
VLRVFVFATLPASALLIMAQTTPPLAPPGIMLFANARAKMQSHLKGQPNYICLETIERSQRDARKKRDSLLDVLRLEVAVIGHKEMYAWPGSNRFDDTELVDMVPRGGTIGSGAFEIHAWNLFFSGGPSIGPAEWTMIKGHRLARYPYDVTQLSSSFRLSVNRSRDWTVVAYHGSIWIDPESEEVTRIQIIADQIPPQLGLLQTDTVVDFGEIQIDGQPYRLPVETSETVTMFSGVEDRNAGRFSACRRFVGESKLVFGDVPPAADKPPAPMLTTVTLPAGLAIDLELLTPVDSDSSKTGDPIEGVLASSIKHKKQILFEKGSRVDGRLVRLQKNGRSIEAELRFYSISSATQQADFTGIAEAANTALEPMPSAFEAVPGQVGRIRIRLWGDRLNVRRGKRIRWVTTAPPRVATEGH